MGKICAFFGPDTCSADLSKLLDNAILRAVKEEDVDTFWFVGSGDFDRQATEAVCRMKKKFPHLRLELGLAYLPKGASKTCAPYDIAFYPDGLSEVPQLIAEPQRNEWMARHCDLVICYPAFSFGSDYHAVQHARNSRKLIWNLI